VVKRFDGEGTVRQRRDGLWEAQIRWRDRFEEPKRTSVYAHSRDEVLDKLARVRERLAEESPAVDARDTVAAWSAHWRQTTLAASDKKQATREQYGNLARVHIEKGSLADRKLRGLKPSHVEGWLVALRAKGLSDSTIRSAYTVLRGTLDTAVRDGLLARNPVHRVRRPKVRRVEVAKLDRAEVRTVLDAAADSRYHSALVLTAMLGLRVGEVLGLRWRDIDDKARTVTVTKTVAGSGKTLRLEDVKSERSRRTLPLSDAAMAVIKAHRKALVADQLKAGDKWQKSGDGMVFRTGLGTLVDTRNLLRVVEKAADDAGLGERGIGMHTLRHAAAVGWLEAGVHIKAVSDLLGHSSIAITGDIYGHTSDDTARSAVDALTTALGYS
jgi:integrase